MILGEDKPGLGFSTLDLQGNSWSGSLISLRQVLGAGATCRPITMELLEIIVPSTEKKSPKMQMLPKLLSKESY